MNTDQFRETLEQAYSFKGKFITMGGAMLDGENLTGTHVRIPLKTMNRHGLIAGATGTGKTKSLQVLAEQLSERGVPVMLMDIKGDLSGLAKASDGHAKIDERHEKIDLDFVPQAFPLEFLSLSKEKGLRLRATVLEFGPVLFSKILGLNDTQSGIVAVLFKYCDDNNLPLLDLKDFKKILQFSTREGKAEIERDYGSISARSVGTIMRKLLELEQQDADLFFGEYSFDVNDLLRTDGEGRGIISILRLTDIQHRPKLFSSFMLQLLAEVYAQFPEEGDMDEPKLVLFIDEAHLIFKEASKALLDQIEIIIKLIRSKGIGIYFCTQNPTDIPDVVLSQLGMKVQHALRAFTAKDRKAIKLVAQNYPETTSYEVSNLITELGIGEALITVLDEKGRPTPVVHTMMRAPQSRMDILSVSEIKEVIDQSELIAKYDEAVDRESAHEILTEKIHQAGKDSHKEKMRRSRRKDDDTLFEEVWNSTTTRQIGRTVARELARGLLGVLGVSSTRRRKKSTGWF